MGIHVSRAADVLYLQAGDDGAVYTISADAFAGLDLGLEDVAQAPKESAAPADGG